MTTFFSKEEEKKIIASIQEAEENTSGEIRLHIQQKSMFDNPLDDAKAVFNKLKMHNTAQRNAILIFICPEEKKLAIFGDKGIHEHVDVNYWNDVILTMSDNFSKGKYLEGCIAGISMCGDKLQKFFPFQRNDINELSDEISQD